MQILVTYYSQTGNTKALAEAIARGVEQVEGVVCLLRPCAEVTREDFVESAAIIAGSPVYYGTMAHELKARFDEFVDVRDQMQDTVGAAFCSAGDSAGGKESTLLSIVMAMFTYGMIIVGDPADDTGCYGVACVGAPDEEARSRASHLGRRVARLARKLS